MILTINGKQATLKKGSSIEYVSENRIFTDADDYSMEIELPLADCPQNLDIFGMITRKEGCRRVEVNHCVDGYGTKWATADSLGEQSPARDHRPSQRTIGRSICHRQHRDWRQGHKAGAGRVPAPHEQ